MTNNPMNVGELIKNLKDLDPDLLVYVQTNGEDYDYMNLYTVIQKTIEIETFTPDENYEGILNRECVCLDFM